MKKIILAALLYAGSAQAGLTKTPMSDLNFKMTDSGALQVCGIDMKSKSRCENYQGIFLKDNKISRYTKLELRGDNFSLNSRLFATIDNDATVYLADDASCTLELYSYRYSLRERLDALALGFMVKNRDTVNLFCEFLDN